MNDEPKFFRIPDGVRVTRAVRIDDYCGGLDTLRSGERVLAMMSGSGQTEGPGPATYTNGVPNYAPAKYSENCLYALFGQGEDTALDEAIRKNAALQEGEQKALERVATMTKGLAQAERDRDEKSARCATLEGQTSHYRRLLTAELEKTRRLEVDLGKVREALGTVKFRELVGEKK